MNMRRLNTVNDNGNTDYDAGMALAAEGRTYACIDTAEQEDGFRDWFDDGRQIYIDIQDCILHGEKLQGYNSGFYDATMNLPYEPTGNMDEEYLYAFGYKAVKPTCRIAEDSITLIDQWRDEDAEEYEIQRNEQRYAGCGRVG